VPADDAPSPFSPPDPASPSAVSPGHLSAPTGAPGDDLRLRVLEAAGRLFAERGIRGTDLDRVIAASGLSRTAFSRIYPAKDDLVADYLTVWHRYEVRVFAEAVEGHRPLDGVARLVDSLVDRVRGRGFQGYPFVVAAVEFPDGHPEVRRAVTAYRDWSTEALTGLLRRAGHPLPGDAADDVVLARDGIVVGASAGDPVSAVAALRRAVDRVLAVATEPVSARPTAEG
jgi:AcrR family transcriptional regulator